MNAYASTRLSAQTAARLPRDAAILLARVSDLRDRLPLADSRRPTVLTIISLIRAADDAWQSNQPEARQHWDSACNLAVRLCGRWND